ncbi:MBL fold hydrolase [candidate division WOR-1 bacterium RIFOXYC2_FULL_37_10]|uniref:MBL fold hydrolase n=1 Tax=candidate division WOR-1 bacterium RIFOXYB2_FULL_37_13 TaxID=1802579 RepID=A0A1F4SPM9_UNCSA|nr:MAG: MBL fold hydrolase [candidate division WOR-1 bacterium RIFOXYA2_FULL_37_7]OGC22406.1 MAG: MBL fold hydrolase [candidate division WOR-1 bacterium RIFOXYB2_FULL_37_13]OGC35388.1 MAG: MBL fold hydrolase [candidate division WOR-1 bacterium RIFOXYC2_FULL_37_10]
MTARKIKDNIYAVSAIDWERKLFDELIPLPEGTSYNSYIVKGSEKTVLLDTVDPTKEKALINNLKEISIENIDYIISHHCEQDHSGSIPKILELYPNAKVVTNQKCADMLKDHLLVPDDNFIIVKDHETLSLGDKTLEFILTPWVHWPETMSTYLKEDKILFSCDFFGSHSSTSDLFAHAESVIYVDAKRYYAEIMMPFRNVIKNNLEKIKDLQIDMIAASHGPIYDKPSFIIDAYKDWVSDNVKNEVVIPYVSMHGSTLEMVHYFADELIKRGISTKLFYLPKTDIGSLAMALVDAATVVIGSPTVLAGAHPSAAYAAFLANALRPKTRFVSIIGSYGWGGKMVEQLAGMLLNLKVEIIPPVVAKGYPKKEDFVSLEKLADSIMERHKSFI